MTNSDISYGKGPRKFLADLPKREPSAEGQELMLTEFLSRYKHRMTSEQHEELINCVLDLRIEIWS